MAASELAVWKGPSGRIPNENNLIEMEGVIPRLSTRWAPSRSLGVGARKPVKVWAGTHSSIERGEITPVTQLCSAINRGYNSIYNWKGAHLVGGGFVFLLPHRFPKTMSFPVVKIGNHHFPESFKVKKIWMKAIRMFKMSPFKKVCTAWLSNLWDQKETFYTSKEKNCDVHSRSLTASSPLKHDGWKTTFGFRSLWCAVKLQVSHPIILVIQINGFTWQLVLRRCVGWSLHFSTHHHHQA